MRIIYNYLFYNINKNLLVKYLPQHRECKFGCVKDAFWFHEIASTERLYTS